MESYGPQFLPAQHELARSCGVITDGSCLIRYSALLQHLLQVERQLLDFGVLPTDPIAFCCGQDLPSAVTLLQLLQRRQGLVLLPERTSLEEVPGFCRFVIRACPAQQLGTLEGIVIRAAIHRKAAAQTLNATGTLYVRSSGTTGASKLIVHGYQKLLRNAANFGRRIGLSRDDRLCIPVPLYHMFGFGAAFLPAVISGSSVDIQKNSNLIRYLERESAFMPTVSFITPGFARLVADARRRVREYRVTVTGGDHLPVSTFDRYSEKCGCLVQLYGSSEMGTMASAGLDDSMEMRRTTCGRPLPGVEIQVDSQTSQILCRHQNAFEGYADSDGGVSIRATEWWDTGDVGSRNEDGRVVVRGRVDSRLKRDGFWVDIQEVERALASIPGVLQVAVVRAPHGIRGEGMIAFCTHEQHAKLSAVDIQSACSSLLHDREIPDEILVLAELPLLPSGKIDRLLLKSRAESEMTTKRI